MSIATSDSAGNPLDPLEYPFETPTGSGLLRDDSYLRLEAQPGRRIGQWLVLDGGGESHGFPEPCVPLNYALLVANVASADARYPVLAVGSNAAPSQLRRKFERQNVSRVVPMTMAHVGGIVAGHSAHVSVAGYIAAAPFAAPDRSSTFFVTWLDRRQLAALDRTEPNYDRVLLDPDVHPVELPSGERLSRCWIYRGRHGVLGHDAPIPLSSQHEIFETMFGAVRDEFGARSFEEFVEACTSSEVQARMKTAFAHRGLAKTDGLATMEDQDEPCYGRAPSFLVGDGLRVGASPDDLERNGEPSVVASNQVWEALGRPEYVAIESTQSGRVRAIGRLTRASHVDSQVILIDQVLRNGLGSEIGEHVDVRALHGTRSALADRLVARRHFLLCRVQTADLITVEQDAALVDQLTLDILGIESGDRIVVEGCPADEVQIRSIRVRAFRVSEEIMERRRQLHGGDEESRFPSSRDALGVYPDLAWIFLDSAMRSRLGINDHKLGCVRVRPSRRHQLAKELRELVLLLMLALIGLLTVLDSGLSRLMALSAVVVVTLLSVIVRMRSKMSRKVDSR